MSLPGYTFQYALKHTDNKLQTLQDKDLTLTLENNLRGGLSGVMGDRYLKLMKLKRFFIWTSPDYMVIQCLKCYLMMKLKCGMVIQIII